MADQMNDPEDLINMGREENTIPENVSSNKDAETSDPTTGNVTSQLSNRIDIQPFLNQMNALQDEAAKVLIGQENLVELILIGIVCGGHILLEGVPGIAKTLSAKVIAKTLDTNFTRIQFTPDLMPSDIIGTSVFNLKDAEFSFIKGPVFSNIVLIDEINRAPAKTQSALFEVMEEKQITFEGKTYPMQFPFFVIATQNPIEQEGTYRLPEAQLDRFLMKIKMDYPTMEDEIKILSRYKSNTQKDLTKSISKIIKKKTLKELMAITKQIHISDQMLRYVAQIVHETRNHAKIYLGGSPRASLALINTAKVAAILAGRDFMTPDDIKFMAPYILNHRIILTPEAEMEGITEEQLIQELVDTVEVPR